MFKNINFQNARAQALAFFFVVMSFSITTAQDYGYPSPYKPVQELRQYPDTGTIIVTKIFNGIIGQPAYMNIPDFISMYGLGGGGSPILSAYKTAVY